jgi:hypothetical protein
MEDAKMKTKMMILFLFLLLLTISVNSFAVITTLTLKGGISRYQGDVKSDIDLYPMGGLSYEVWMTKFLSIGLDPYYTYIAAGETPDYAFESHLGGGDVLLKLRPFEISLGNGAINKMAPYIVAGGGMVNYFPKVKGAPLEPGYDYIGADTDMQDKSAKWNTSVFPTIGGGITFMTQHGFTWI